MTEEPSRAEIKKIVAATRQQADELAEAFDKIVNVLQHRHDLSNRDTFGVVWFFLGDMYEKSAELALANMTKESVVELFASAAGSMVDLQTRIKHADVIKPAEAQDNETMH